MTQRVEAKLKISLKTTSSIFVLLNHTAALPVEQVPGSILDEPMTRILLRRHIRVMLKYRGQACKGVGAHCQVSAHSSLLIVATLSLYEPQIALIPFSVLPKQHQEDIAAFPYMFIPLRSG